MLTAVAHKNLADAESYFDEHLAQNDYYAASEIHLGQWIGAGAERLGLKNVVTREQFHSLCENQNPETSERLTQRQQKEDKRRVFYDFTCSAPKSVSVLAVTLADDRLVTAHEEAARIACSKLIPAQRAGLWTGASKEASARPPEGAGRVALSRFVRHRLNRNSSCRCSAFSCHFTYFRIISASKPTVPTQ